ncbi:hypothetical protein KFE25_012580 [Diacronema lutheri]|uniref:Uncharacterized protein n=1 Tax=Diacronema lutheri TaxID=2081491 RepID=A0A8J6C8A1_DIALT|nr:hypothetical protein KFE25_012580 [Diacronema lutheri]
MACVVGILAATAMSPGRTTRFPTEIATRRSALATLVGVAPFALDVLASPRAARAFENGVAEMDKYKDKPKQRGPKPNDIGLKTRVINADGDEAVGAVKICGGAPNCFTTTGDMAMPGDSEHLIPFWRPPKGASAEAAMRDVVDVLKAYTPGQSGIDGGGFKIVTADAGYVYAQFESLRQGYIDDLEIALAQNGGDALAVQVRSSSRLGYLDFGVNALRLNAISKELRARGWTAAEITPKSHAQYWALNAPRR